MTDKKVQPTPVEQRTQGYWVLLNRVIDPELDVGIVDLGLVYEVEITESGETTVYMTLTSMGCPAGPELMRGVETAMEEYEGVKGVHVEIVWEPVWGPDLVNPDIRAMLWGAE